MNDLHFIFYDPKLMYVDTSDMSLHTERAHRRLCDYIWFNDGPPLNENEKLRQITHTEVCDWSRVKRELMGKGWVESSNFFLHRGAIESLNESKLKFAENHNRTAAANKKPRLQPLPPHPDTGVVMLQNQNPDVTPPVTPDVTPPVTVGHLELESDTTKTTKHDQALKGNPKGGPGENIPSKKLVRSLSELARRFEECLNGGWLNDAGKWINRVKKHPAKCERVVAELELAQRERRVRTSAAQYAEQIWKEFA